MSLDSPLTPITDLAIRIPEPQWDKEASVQTWLTNGLGVAIAVVGFTDPDFRWPSWTHAVIPILAAVIVSFAQEIIRKRAARRAQLAGARAALVIGV